MKTRTLLIAIIIIGTLAAIFWPKHKEAANEVGQAPMQEESILGCYEAKIAKDVYTMKITEQDGLSVSGTLAYKNFEKDSSSGTLTGIFDGTMLLGEYTFRSEGMDSVSQVAFKKVSDGFVRGFGETQTVGNKEMLSDTTNLSYDNSPVFVKTNCQ